VQAVFQARGIDPRTREMIILRAANVINAPYEWRANAQMAKNGGSSKKTH
jgi:Carboxymuconolactone decarboxylase family